jgi:hypothetical protein
MPVSKEDIITAVRESHGEIERTALSLSDEALGSGVYESGWNAKQLLCHLAAGGGFAAFMISFAQMPPSASAGTGDNFDLDAFNAREVESREKKPLSELLAELRSGSERSIVAVQGAPDELLAAHFRAPWGTEGALADVIVQSLQGHVGTHLAELKSATG